MFRQGNVAMQMLIKIFLSACFFYPAYQMASGDASLLDGHSSSRRANAGAWALQTIHFYLGDLGGAMLLTLIGIGLLWSAFGLPFPWEPGFATAKGESGDVTNPFQAMRSAKPDSATLPAGSATSFGRRRAPISSVSAPQAATAQSYPETLDVTELADVRWIMEAGNPAIWHQAAMAALAYRGDPHGLLPWLIARPAIDRATVGWIFFWAEGDRYLQGETNFDGFDHVSSEQMLSLFAMIGERSLDMPFGQDVIGLDPDFEPVRQRCIVAAKTAGPNIAVPRQLLNKAFGTPQNTSPYLLEDGELILVA